jgi:hypothetical protein
LRTGGGRVVRSERRQFRVFDGGRSGLEEDQT